MTAVDHLALAKEDLAIAESADAKREAYRRAAEHIAAHIEETGDTVRDIAISLFGERKGEKRVHKLLSWRKADYPEGTTPYTMPDGSGDKPTTRAAKSHAKAVLRDPEQRREVIESMTEAERLEVAQAAMEPMYREADRKGKEQRAVRESKPNQDRTHVELIINSLGKANISIQRAVIDAGGTTWTAEGAAMVDNGIEGTIAWLDKLRAAVAPSGENVDWDDALAQLGEEG